MLNGTIPARFLTIAAHTVLTIVLFWSKGANIEACLPVTYLQDPSAYTSQYDHLNTELIIGLAISLGLFAFELIGFLGGLSMFVYIQGLFSILAHGSGTVMLILFMFDYWCSTLYWYIFGFCCAPPFVTEIIVWTNKFCLK